MAVYLNGMIRLVYFPIIVETPDAVMVCRKEDAQSVKKIVESTKIPVVLLDFHIDDLPCDAVVSNNYVGMYKMTRYLLERGHREIAFVGSIYANENIMDRYFGYRKGMMEYGISVKGIH